jgi:hypothetical protein
MHTFTCLVLRSTCMYIYIYIYVATYIKDYSRYTCTYDDTHVYAYNKKITVVQSTVFKCKIKRSFLY